MKDNQMPIIKTNCSNVVLDCLTTEQLAERLNVSPSLLEKARSTGSLNVPYIYVGKSVRYPVKELDAWISENLVKAEYPAMVLGISKSAAKKDN